MPRGPQINWKDRKPRRRIVPKECKGKRFTPFYVSIYTHARPFYLGPPLDPEECFIPECPNPFPDKIDFAEWVAVDSMGGEEGDPSTFQVDYAWFRDVIESAETYEMIVTQAADHIIETTEEMMRIKLTREIAKLVIPLFLEKLTARRILLWCFRTRGTVKEVGKYLSYAKGKDDTFPGLRTLILRVGLTVPAVMDPIRAHEVFETEKEWLQIT